MTAMQTLLDELLEKNEDGVELVLHVSNAQYAGAVRKLPDGLLQLMTFVQGQDRQVRTMMFYFDPKEVRAVGVPQEQTQVVTPRNGSGLVIPGMK